jgi:hypothetical protein
VVHYSEPGGLASSVRHLTARFPLRNQLSLLHSLLRAKQTSGPNVRPLRATMLRTRSAKAAPAVLTARSGLIWRTFATSVLRT